MRIRTTVTAALTAWAAAVPLLASGAEQAAAPVSRGHNPGDLGASLMFGLRLGVIGLAAVFLGLVAVYAFLLLLHHVLEGRPARAAGSTGAAGGRPARTQISSEVAHAIALALYMDLRTFDEETAEEITIKKITQAFSPWTDAAKTQIVLNSRTTFGK